MTNTLSAAERRNWLAAAGIDARKLAAPVPPSTLRRARNAAATADFGLR